MSDVKKLIEDAGGTIDPGSIMALPDGTGCLTASFPLPKDHWLTQPGDNEHPPAPWRIGTGAQRDQWAADITAATRYAARCATMNGADNDFDPDALVQNMVVGMLGYWTEDGKSRL